MENRVNVNIEEHIAHVELNRPDKMNALDIPMFNAIVEAGKQVSENEEVRVVVLSGKGRAFCAGLDLSNFTPDPEAEMNQSLLPRTHGIANKWQKVAWVWRECPVPVVAAVHGIAYGGGLQIMSGADIKYIHPDTQLSIMESKWGIIPDMSGTQLWRHNVREDVLKELTFTHRKFTGTEAVEYGFGTHVSENPLEDAMNLARKISEVSPSAIVQSKALINKASYLNEKEGLLLESDLQQKIIRQENQMEAVFSQMQKRSANFKPFRNK